MTGSALATRTVSVPVGSEVDALVRIASNLNAAGIYRKTASSPEAVFAVLLAARDMGVSATAALAGGIHMVEGKLEVSANLQAQLLREYRGPEGQRYDFRILTPVADRSKRCHIEFKRREPDEPWEVIGEELFTLDDAKTAGLAGKDNYKKYPKMMLLARCLSDGIASHCPETARGLRIYGESEIGGASPVAPLADEPLTQEQAQGGGPGVDDEPVDATVVDDGPAVDSQDPKLADAAVVDDDTALAELLADDGPLKTLRFAADAGMRSQQASTRKRLLSLQKYDTREALEALIDRLAAEPETATNGANA